MTDFRHRNFSICLLLAFLTPLPTIQSQLLAADKPARTASATDGHWRTGIDLIETGKFDDAATELNKIDRGGNLTDSLKGWLNDYQTKQAKRRDMDRADLDKYVEYAKARYERKEYDIALEKAMLAHDVAADQDAFLKSDWLQKLVNDSLKYADEQREKSEWHEAWEIYWRLAQLYEREPRYQKLEREALTHLRLDAMFEDDTNWQDRLERIRWEDAETALECVELYYHNLEPDHFKKITESGIEQVLMLVDSKSGQKSLDALKDQINRNDFKSRVQTKLDQVRSDPTIDRGDAVAFFRRVLDINEQTIRLPKELVVSEMMRGALDPLDDFTTIIWPQETDEFEKHTRGDFIGVGISIVKNRVSDEIEVVTPLEDTPAYRAGIQTGDIILKVDGEALKGRSINKVVDLIMGPKDTPVTLTVKRKDKEIEFPLLRDVITIQSIKGVARKTDDPEHWDHWLDQERGIGYVRVTNFQSNTVEHLENTLSQMQPKGLRGLILDLRGNPGGLLDSAWRLASIFLHNGDKIVYTKGRQKLENQDFRTTGEGAYANIPLVVLTDEGSASASEIVAGAIRDNHRGQVIGARTFGKFSVQNLIQLGRSNAKLKITTADYYLPSGVSLHRRPTSENWGVQPDLPVRLVRKERINLYQGWRSAERIGPNGGKVDDGLDANDEENEMIRDIEGPTQGPRDLPPEVLPPYNVKYSLLPPLKQPDTNDRPKGEDPQLETALLVLRASLLESANPTLATANVEAEKDTAKP